MAEIIQIYVVPITGKFTKRWTEVKAGKQIEHIEGDEKEKIGVVPLFELRPQIPDMDDPNYDEMMKIRSGFTYSVEEYDLDNSTATIILKAEPELHDWLASLLKGKSIANLYSDTGKSMVKDGTKKSE